MHGCNDENGSEECGLVDALRTLVEGADLNLPKTANRIEVFSATLSMWIAGTCRLSGAQQLAIKDFLKRRDL
jgi:hypothetical protein